MQVVAEAYRRRREGGRCVPCLPVLLAGCFTSSGRPMGAFPPPPTAHTMIKAVHRRSPPLHPAGPGVYAPRTMRAGRDPVPTPLLASGPLDRFHNRAEPGRLQ